MNNVIERVIRILVFIKVLNKVRHNEVREHIVKNGY